MFRFQIGAIKRQFKYELRPLTAESFDSKLVRLKVLFRNAHRRRQSKFRFQIGAIKRAGTEHDEVASSGFDSKLVRLKAKDKW